MPSARHRPRSFRRSVVVTFTAVVGGCGGTVGANPSDAGADAPRDDATAPGCPADPEGAIGAPCAAPEASPCTYDRCHAPEWSGGVTLTCAGGVWSATGRSSCNPPPPAACPDGGPVAGAPCEGSLSCRAPTYCCGQPAADEVFTCVGGKWELTQAQPACNPPAPQCPATAPADGDSCATPCDLAYPSPCAYGDCYGSPTKYATCASGVWRIAELSCNPPPPDAGIDAPEAGADGGGVGEPCGQSANGAACAAGLVCCYPCGIPGCTFTCTEPCDPATPGCFAGCLERP